MNALPKLSYVSVEPDGQLAPVGGPIVSVWVELQPQSTASNTARRYVYIGPFLGRQLPTRNPGAAVCWFNLLAESRVAQLSCIACAVAVPRRLEQVGVTVGPVDTQLPRSSRAAAVGRDHSRSSHAAS